MLDAIKMYFYSKYLKLNLKRHNTILNSINVGKNVQIGNNCIISKRVILGDNVSIDNFTYLNSSKYWITIESNVKIGKFCSVAPGVFIGAGNHDYNFVTTHPILFDSYYDDVTNLDSVKRKANGLKDKDCITIIGNDVWIGQNAILKRGISVGNGSVIAGGSVVVKDVPPFAIVGGNPAKIIKFRMSKERIEKVLENDEKVWWNKSITEIASEIENMYDIERYVDTL